jgi:shikimate dehydrogenase
MPDRYAVIGHPIAHSKSPTIHAAFARSTGQDIVYERLLAPLDGFRAAVERFAAEGGKGLNVTIPFKREAFAVAATITERARLAGAVNTLQRRDDAWHADNTDGAGLVRDVVTNLGVDLHGQPIAILGAGGAVRGILKPLFDAGVASVTVTNRTMAKAVEIAAQFARYGRVEAVAPDALRPHPVVINATSLGMGGAVVDRFPFDGHVVAPGAFACDLIYSDTETAFMRWAREHGAARRTDGLGMLIEQAAESFALWRGVRPDTRSVFALMRPGA